MPHPGTGEIGSMTAILGLRTGAAWALMAVSPLALGAEPGANEPITAVYKAQEVSFQYRSSNRFYPCHELEHRVAVILVAVGARDDITVKARNCDAFMIDNGNNNIDPMTGRDNMDPFERDRWGTSSSRFGRTNDRREQYASVRVQLMVPVQVTPQVLKEIEKDKSRRELVSRVTGNMATAFNDPVIFEAKRQEVTLSQRTIRLRAEDCELLDQMSNSVFRKLNVKVLRRSFSCGPRDSESRIAPQLVAEALLPTGSLLPMPDPEKEKEKEKGSAVPEQPAAEPAAPAEPPPQQ
jgi:hypothetical protein